MTVLRDLPLRTVPIVEPYTSLADALEMRDSDPLRTVVIVGDGQFLGVFDDESLADGMPQGESPANISVGPYAHHARVIASPKTSVHDALTLLNLRGRDVLPVVQGIIYRGVVTREDLERAAGARGVAAADAAATDIAAADADISVAAH